MHARDKMFFNRKIKMPFLSWSVDNMAKEIISGLEDISKWMKNIELNIQETWDNYKM